MSKKALKKSLLKKFSILKQTKVLIVLIFVIGFAGIGVKQLRSGSAATVTIPVTFPTTSGLMGHQTGNFLSTSVAELLNGVRTYVNVRRWPATLTYIDSYQKTHFLQYGPYVDITIPGNKTGLHVCHYYSTWNVLGYSGYVKVNTDMTEANHLNFFRTAREPWFPSYRQITEEARSKYNEPTLRSHCDNYKFHWLEYGINPPTTLHSVEFRVKVYNASDQFGVVDLWKTTVSYY